MDFLQILNDYGYPALFIIYLIYKSNKDEEKYNSLSDTFKESLQKIVDSLSSEITEVKEDVKGIKEKLGGEAD